jgi:hypothetical protein
MDMEQKRQRQQTSRQEKGQILLFLAVAFVGLLAFIGLAMDVGILFISIGHLRRGVDAAALAAAAQFREGRTYQEVNQAATEFFELNQGSALSGTIFIETCMPTDPNNPGPVLCLNPPRKFVRVSGQAEVPFTFLRLIGWETIDINSQSVSEAASLDVVLILDTSESMAFDASCSDMDDDDDDGLDDECGDADGDGCLSGDACDPGDTEKFDDWGPNGFEDDYYRDPNVCNSDPLGLGDWDDPPGTDTTPGECHPFEEVQEAAISFVGNLNTPFDRVAIVTFAQTPFIDYPLQSDLANAANTIRSGLLVTPRPGLPDCNFPIDPDPSDCTSTSIGGGLRNAASAFSQPLGGATQIREESLWVAVLLSDGAANASIPDDVDLDPKNLYCPPSTWPPWPPIVNQPPACRDSSATTRHSLLPGPKNNPNNVADPPGTFYDTDDYAHDMADLVACPSRYDVLDPNFDPWCLDGINYGAGDGGQDALIFTIGLGAQVINTAYGDPDAGEQLLRYVAGVGFDGYPDPNFAGIADECLTAPSATDCGNYFFAPSGAQLIQIFEEIASRIFTRLVQ